MENDDRVGKYLKRIELNHPTNGPTEEYLNQLHIAHLTHIPFETFDLIDFKQLDISLDFIFNQLVEQQRGGVCYHMNGLFEFILKKFNYNVKIIGCAVHLADKNKYCEELSHEALYVTLNNDKKFLCDVGFSRDFLTPLFFSIDSIQYATNGFFRIIKSEDGLFYKVERGFLNKNENISLPNSSTPQTHIIDINPEYFKWVISYRFPIDFDKQSIKLKDFEGKCPYIINSPDCILNHCTICHLHTYKPVIGAISIIGKEFWEWIIENGIEIRRNYPILNNDDEIKKLLKEKFNLIIERKLTLIHESK